MLGYDVFDPREVLPEFICDVGTKKGEKIDYAIHHGGEVQMLIEAKAIGAPLKVENEGQLIRYFHVSNARIGVLTNGQVWNFYSDLDRPNVMDSRPFLRLDLLDVDAYLLPELEKLTKSSFNLDSVLEAGRDLKYLSAIKQEIAAEFSSPSDDFVRLFATRVYDGTLTAARREQFSLLVSKAAKQFVAERVTDRLNNAVQSGEARVPTPTAEAPAAEPVPVPADSTENSVSTTEIELEGYNIVRAILASEVPMSRIHMRDQKTYCGILLDNNNRRPLCRLWFNSSNRRYLGLFDESKVETRHPVASVEEIYNHCDELRETVRRYLTPSGAAAADTAPPDDPS